jgi:hypothetical protein
MGTDEGMGFGKTEKPGEFLPVVDSKDVRAVWEFFDKEEKNFGTNHMVGFNLIQQVCKLGPDGYLVLHRTTRLRTWLMGCGVDASDAVYRAVAKLPIELIEIAEGKQGCQFDEKELLRLCSEES